MYVDERANGNRKGLWQRIHNWIMEESLKWISFDNTQVEEFWFSHEFSMTLRKRTRISLVELFEEPFSNALTVQSVLRFPYQRKSKPISACSNSSVWRCFRYVCACFIEFYLVIASSNKQHFFDINSVQPERLLLHLLFDTRQSSCEIRYNSPFQSSKREYQSFGTHPSKSIKWLFLCLNDRQTVHLTPSHSPFS